MMGAPRLSVLMSVYNGERYLSECIASILNQKFKDFEFVIVDDGSTDHTWNILVEYAERDRRIVLLRNQPNAGVVRALNKGLDRVSGAVIARQDADDVSHAERLQRQLDFLDSHLNVGVVAAVPQLVDAEGDPIDRSQYTATENEDIQRLLPDHMCLCGPTIMARRDSLQQAGFYFTDGLNASEDYDICLRLSEVTQIASLGGFLYQYRQHQQSASRTQEQRQAINKARALEQAMYRRYGEHPSIDRFALVGRDYLRAAIIGMTIDDLVTAKSSLERGLAVYPPLLEDDQPVENLVCSYTPRQTASAALLFNESVFDSLLPKTRLLTQMKSRLLSSIHMSEVFAGVSQGQDGRVRDHLWLGIRRNPAWLMNRGVVTILFRSVLSLKSGREKTSN